MNKLLMPTSNTSTVVWQKTYQTKFSKLQWTKSTLIWCCVAHENVLPKTPNCLSNWVLYYIIFFTTTYFIFNTLVLKTQFFLLNENNRWGNLFKQRHDTDFLPKPRHLLDKCFFANTSAIQSQKCLAKDSFNLRKTGDAFFTNVFLT